MRPLGVVLAVVIGVNALAGTIWLGRYSPLAEPHTRKKMAWEEGTAEAQMVLAKLRLREAAKEKEEKEKEAKKLTEKRPPVADKPPYPKARTGERVYEFGSMGVDEEKKHTFHVENRGQVPLLIAKGPTNCKCTISNISQSTIPPGGSAEVEMSWTPREVTPTFAIDRRPSGRTIPSFPRSNSKFSARSSGNSSCPHARTHLARRPCDGRSRRGTGRRNREFVDRS